MTFIGTIKLQYRYMNFGVWVNRVFSPVNDVTSLKDFLEELNRYAEKTPRLADKIVKGEVQRDFFKQSTW